MSANKIWTLFYSERVQATSFDKEEDLEGVNGLKEDVVQSDDDTKNEDKDDKSDNGECKILDQQDNRQHDTVRTSKGPFINQGLPKGFKKIQAVIEKEPQRKGMTTIKQVLQWLPNQLIH